MRGQLERWNPRIRSATARGGVLSAISMFGERGTRVQMIRPRAVFHGIPGSPSLMRIEKAGSRSAARARSLRCREGRSPYFFWAVYIDPVRRPELFRLAWKDVGKVLIVALVLDVIYELIVYRWSIPGRH